MSGKEFIGIIEACKVGTEVIYEPIPANFKINARSPYPLKPIFTSLTRSIEYMHMLRDDFGFSLDPVWDTKL